LRAQVPQEWLNQRVFLFVEKYLISTLAREIEPARLFNSFNFRSLRRAKIDRLLGLNQRLLEDVNNSIHQNKVPGA
jgi:hypothetical protein